MLQRSAASLLAILSLAMPAAVHAADAGAPRPAMGCTAETATAADVAEVAYDPDAFAGKCVALKGYWRDTAVYPTRAEATQPDAERMSFLDRRRIGLYLADKDLAQAPAAPHLSDVVGTVGICAKLAPEAAGMGYCHYKPGAYLAVASATPAK